MTRPPDRQSPATWEEEGRMLRRRKEAATWDLGDWLVRGQGWQLDPGFKRSQAITGYSHSHLHALHRVALLWPIHDRVSTFPWLGHRSLLRVLDGTERRELLALAVKEHWTSGDLDRYLIDNPPEKTSPARKPPSAERQMARVRCPNCQHEFPMNTHKVPKTMTLVDRKVS